MTEQAAQVMDTSQDLSTEQIDKFFESGGKELPEAGPAIDTAENKTQDTENTEKTQEQVQDVVQPEKPIDNATVEEEKHARNYQAAMKEERARRQELQRQLEETSQKTARMEDVFQKFLVKQQLENMPKPPSFDEDPIGHQQHEINELKDYIAQQNAYLKNQEQHKIVNAQRENFINTYKNHAERFAETTPDFWDAYKYLVGKRETEYMAGGLNKDEARQQIEFEEAQIVSRALREGVNPAERAYAMAKAAGFAMAPKANSNEAPPERHIDQEMLKEAQRKIDELQKSMNANKTIGTTPGKTDTTSSNTPTLARLSAMDEDELNDFISDDSSWKKLMKAG